MKKNKPCYFCGGKSSGVEHVPARQMFSGFKCDSVTVPSCEKHNNNKSGNDEAIVKAMLMSLHSIEYQHQLKSNVKKAIDIARPNFDQVKQTVEMKSLINTNVHPIFLTKLAFLKNSANIRLWMIQLTAGWIWDCLKAFDKNIDWNSALAISHDHIDSKDVAGKNHLELVDLMKSNLIERNKLLQLPWIDGWSASPRAYPEDIYNFKLTFGEEHMYFRHQLFTSYIWFVEFKLSLDARNKLMSRLKLKQHGDRIIAAYQVA